uniref:Glutathione peroxidase n=1 Tax=Rhodosorus marinus TaxID=101924 RepID=A0A7S0BUR8_9RHOD|mmetsp:Transcript_8984/g.13099  ORF Transcript_8984/g.13099 Transcript_8984/m.13099 type:complete len:229 (+) Transcript_8984:22-708(+)
MAFTTGGLRPLRRSGSSKALKCTVSEPSRREFLKLAVPSVVAGWPTFGLAEDARATSLYDLNSTMGGKKIELSKYRGKVALVVNVATYCVLTPQYEQLSALYEKHASRGLEILAYPCNQFGNQEPGDYEDICRFAREQYGARFSIFDKVNVNPPNVDNVYSFLKSTNPDSEKRIEWNFAKFLVDKDGKTVRRYKPGILPSMLEEDIVALLDEKPLPPRLVPKPQVIAL